jgi:hypothetical protein
LRCPEFRPIPSTLGRSKRYNRVFSLGLRIKAWATRSVVLVKAWACLACRRCSGIVTLAYARRDCTLEFKVMGSVACLWASARVVGCTLIGLTESRVRWKGAITEGLAGARATVGEGSSVDAIEIGLSGARIGLSGTIIGLVGSDSGVGDAGEAEISESIGTKSPESLKYSSGSTNRWRRGLRSRPGEGVLACLLRRRGSSSGLEVHCSVTGTLAVGLNREVFYSLGLKDAIWGGGELFWGI